MDARKTGQNTAIKSQFIAVFFQRKNNAHMMPFDGQVTINLLFNNNYQIALALAIMQKNNPFDRFT